ncbi:MAG: response regulator transcription factor [Ruminococcus sp.]|nr:response regulator transcription factor [Ruminococcus sp.]
MNILAVDDEVKIREAVSDYLIHKGMTVLTAENGRQALELFSTQTVDFIILDLMLPDITGEEICHRIRKNSFVPIIMLTAKSQEEDMLRGLDLGADDYIKKPFSLKELYARMQTVLRRTGKPSEVQHYGELSVNLQEMILHKNDKEIPLTASEWKLLTVFIKNAGNVLSREQLIETAFGIDFDSYDRVIDTHIKNLRRKIESDPHSPKYIKTVHGIGYRFEVSR